MKNNIEREIVIMDLIYHFGEVFNLGCVDVVEKSIHSKVSSVSILERSTKMLKWNGILNEYSKKISKKVD